MVMHLNYANVILLHYDDIITLDYGYIIMLPQCKYITILY